MCLLPVRLFDVVLWAGLVQTQNQIESLSWGGQSALPLLWHLTSPAPVQHTWREITTRTSFRTAGILFESSTTHNSMMPKRQLVSCSTATSDWYTSVTLISGTPLVTKCHYCNCMSTTHAVCSEFALNTWRHTVPWYVVVKLHWSAGLLLEHQAYSLFTEML